MLRAEFLEPLGLTQTEAAARLRIPARRLGAIVRGRRGALRLERLLGTEAAFWLNLQMGWDRDHAMHAPTVAESRRIRPVRRTASTQAPAGAEGEW